MPKIVSKNEYISRANKVHSSKYTYEPSTILGSRFPVTIICPIHGAFKQKLANHLSGAGCPKCAGKGVDWVDRFKSVHGNKYDYSLVNYEGYKTKVTIVCPKHGQFAQTPDNHYRGKQGCPKCKNQRIRSTKQLKVDTFIERAKTVHGDKFTYEKKQFKNMLTGKVSINCPLHGEFTQSPVNHLAGKIGCAQCNNMKSKAETEVLNFIKTFTPAESRNRTVIRPKELDIYLPEHNLAIEYCGMYWHSHGDKDDERANKHKHYTKHKQCAEKGVRLITIFESEWERNPQAIKRLLRNAIGKSRGKVMARKCELRKVSTKEAKVFYNKYHPQGGTGHGEHYALFWKDKMVACMRFTLGGNDRGNAAKSRTWTLSRYATRITVTGGASRLFKAFVSEHKPDKVKSFSDNRYFSGGMYTQLGFTLEEETTPDYQVWSAKLGLLPKPHYQRRNIPKRLKEHGLDTVFDPETDPRTEAEITYEMGARRIFDCGKKRWAWSN